MIGLDTGFFVELLRGNSEAVTVWKEIIDSKEEAVVSCITIFELKRLALRGAIDSKYVETTVYAIFAAAEVVWIDSQEICERASNLSHGLGMPAMDALILSGLLKLEAQTIYTVDSHFEAYKKKGVIVKNISLALAP